MNYDIVIGHNDLKNKLKKIVESGRIAQGIMFSGKEGSGNLALAVAFASDILCRNSEDLQICRKQCDKLIHPDLHFCFPVTTTQKVKSNPVSASFLNEWREALTANPYLTPFEWFRHLGVENKQGIINVRQSSEILTELSLKPFASEYKVMIIWLPERMNKPAANKLLKILEEPPEKTVFLLVSQNPELLLPTILSRVQNIRVKPISRSDMEQALIGQYDLPREQAALIAKAAQGNYNEARRMISESETEQFNREKFIEWMRLLWTKEYDRLLKWIDEVARIGRERQKMFMKYSLHIIRESLIKGYSGDDLSFSGGEEETFLEKFHKYVNAANAVEMMILFEDASYHVASNANPRILLADMSFRLMKLIRKTP